MALSISLPDLLCKALVDVWVTTRHHKSCAVRSGVVCGELDAARNQLSLQPCVYRAGAKLIRQLALHDAPTFAVAWVG